MGAAGHHLVRRDPAGAAGRAVPHRLARQLGSQRWFSLGPLQLQPSEFATLVLIVAIATYCARRPEGLEFRDLVRMVLMAALPIVLIIKQPDLGTAIVCSVILLVMLAVAGMPGRYLILLVVGAVLLIVVALNLGLVKHYQIQRLTSFISPNSASTNVTYNVNEAKTAIAHGGIFGQGLFKGAQTNLAYVPEQQTDFIFSAVGEQLGFVGAGVLLVLYGILAWRIMRVAQHGQGHLRPTPVFGSVRPAHVLGLRERGHEHGDHAGGRHPAPLPLLRGIGHDRLHGGHRHRDQRALPEHPVTVPDPATSGPVGTVGEPADAATPGDGATEVEPLRHPIRPGRRTAPRSSGWRWSPRSPSTCPTSTRRCACGRWRRLGASSPSRRDSRTPWPCPMPSGVSPRRGR